LIYQTLINILEDNERSAAYKEFVTEYSKLEASKPAVEAISAKALLALIIQ